MSDDTLLVTALADGTGKTAVTIALGLHARDRDEAVGYMKPKGTRLRSRVGKTVDEDPMLARELLGFEAEMHEMEPVVYSPTFVEQAVRGQANPADLRAQIEEHFDTLSAEADRMFLEGGGTLTTGGIVDLTDADVADYVDAEVLVIAGYDSPGDLDDVLAAVDTVGQDRLRGVLFNAVDDAAFDGLEEDAVPFLEERDVPVLGAIPRVQELAGVTVGDLADELGARVLTNVPTDDYVERFSVGAMGADSALRHFRRTRDAAVITGGDRSDVQTAALEAPGVNCLILTGGHRPSSAVVGAAEEKGVPIVLVQTDTLTTIDRAEKVVSGGRTRDPDAVKRMQGLLGDHADVDAILGDGA
ncbi:AAA family ATPase [Salinarchaeum chitinilyticum]